MLLHDTQAYVQLYFFGNSDKSINYHTWFLYELILETLIECENKFLNKRYIDRHTSHPINILQYFQPNAGETQIEIPEELQTQFQMFGSLMDDFDMSGQGNGAKKVTSKTFNQIKNSIFQFILSRFMVYKWVGPFNEMYFKFHQ